MSRVYGIYRTGAREYVGNVHTVHLCKKETYIHVGVFVGVCSIGIHLHKVFMHMWCILHNEYKTCKQMFYDIIKQIMNLEKLHT